MRGFILGIITTVLIIIVGGYLFVTGGGVPMETTATPLPLEQTVAGMAIRASIANAGDRKNPLSLSDDNLLAGARAYKENCAACHGTPGGQPSALSKGMAPAPPQLFEKDGMVVDDPEGVIYWIVAHGIRLSGMPGFARALTDTERWQVTMLVAHSDKLSPPVKAAIAH